MKYRTVHLYPLVNEKINKAVEVVASKQMAVAEVMRKTQGDALASTFPFPARRGDVWLTASRAG